MYAILRFIFPALTNREKVVLMSILVAGSGFFLVGLGVAYAKTLPIVLKTIIAFGLVFQLPLIIFVLGWFGVVTSKGLRDKRRIAIVMSFVLSMFLTPPDPMSQIFMAVPLCLLYELSIWMVWLKEKGTFGK